MSSSRDHTTLTGAPAAFDVSSASRRKSSSNRRPKPPPRYVVCTLTFSGGTPPIPAPSPWAPVWNCVGAQMRSEEHTSELQSHSDLVCRLLLEKKKTKNNEAHQRQ